MEQGGKSGQDPGALSSQSSPWPLPPPFLAPSPPSRDINSIPLLVYLRISLSASLRSQFQAVPGRNRLERGLSWKVLAPLEDPQRWRKMGGHLWMLCEKVSSPIPIPELFKQSQMSIYLPEILTR